MRRVLIIVLLLICMIPSFGFCMGSRTQRGVVIFFNKSGVVLKTKETKLENVCSAIESLAGIKIIVDDELLSSNISVDLTEKDVESLILKVVQQAPSARHIKVVEGEGKNERKYYIIFSKSPYYKEVDVVQASKKDGLEEAFLAKHDGLRISGRLSVSGTFFVDSNRGYSFPDDIKRYAFDFLAKNRSLLNLNNVTLRVKRIGNNYIDYEQFYNGVAIDNLRSYAFEVKSMEKDGKTMMVISNNTIPEINISVQPAITEEKAVALVVEEIKAKEKKGKLLAAGDIIPENVELKILPQLDTKTDSIIEKFAAMTLYWSVNIDFYNYYVDAKTGKVYKVKTL